MRASSSSSLPWVRVASSSRVKWVKMPDRTLAVKASAVTNIPACIMSCAVPTLRRKVDFPPPLAPVMTVRALWSASVVVP